MANETHAEYERGRLDAAVEGRLMALERTVDQHAKAMEELNGHLAELSHSVDSLAETVRQKKAVDSALQAALTESTRRQLSARQFYFGLGGMVAAFGGMTAGIITAVH